MSSVGGSRRGLIQITKEMQETSCQRENKL
jgi:hypothetical protein